MEIANEAGFFLNGAFKIKQKVYAKNPKLKYLAEINGITLKGFTDGLEEIALFANKDYKPLEVSTNRKVGVISDILDLSFKTQLKTDTLEAIFIVHGHDLRSRDILDKFLRGLGLKTIILDEKPDESMTLIEKFEKYALEATLAICILTPDDAAESKGKETRRARQNVILEMGYFFGKLGRKKVILLYQKPVEIPSDIYGITYIPFKDIRSIEGKIANALKNLKVLH